MTTLIQPTSNVNSVNTVTPLYVVREISQNGTVTSSAAVTPSSITSLGATSASDSLTYDAISLLQSFSPTFTVSGLTAAQQQQLALALGLNADATSDDLANAINSLLTPVNPDDQLVNVLVGGTTTETTNSTIPNFLNSNGEIAGVPVSTTTQAADTVFSTLLALGATTTTINAATTNNIETAESSTAASTNQTGTVTSNVQANLITNNSQSMAAIKLASNTNVAQEIFPTANSNIGIAEYLATAGTTNTAITPSQAPIESPVVPSANPASNIASVEAEVASVAAANSGQVLGNIATTNANLLASEYLATAELNTSASVSNNVTSTPEALSYGNTNQAASVANTSALTTTTTVSASSSAAIATITENLVAEYAIQTESNLPAINSAATEVQTTSSISNTVAPTVTTSNPNAAVIAATTLEQAAVANPVPTSNPAEAALSTTNVAPSAFDNANSVLQALLADAASHSLIATTQATATYSAPGTVYQLNSGIDHTRQATLKGKFANIRDMLNPVIRVAPIRGSLERKT